MRLTIPLQTSLNLGVSVTHSICSTDVSSMKKALISSFILLITMLSLRCGRLRRTHYETHSFLSVPFISFFTARELPGKSMRTQWQS